MYPVMYLLSVLILCLCLCRYLKGRLLKWWVCGTTLFGLSIVSNGLAFFLNSSRMPVRGMSFAVASSWIPMTESTRMNWLADWIHVGVLGASYSLGDALLCLGVIVLVIVGSVRILSSRRRTHEPTSGSNTIWRGRSIGSIRYLHGLPRRVRIC